MLVIQYSHIMDGETEQELVPSDEVLYSL